MDNNGNRGSYKSWTECRSALPTAGVPQTSFQCKDYTYAGRQGLQITTFKHFFKFGRFYKRQGSQNIETHVPRVYFDSFQKKMIHWMSDHMLDGTTAIEWARTRGNCKSRFLAVSWN